MNQSEIENDDLFKKMLIEMRNTPDYQKIEKFHKNSEEKAKIIYKKFSDAFISILLREPGIDIPQWPPMETYLAAAFKIENVDARYLSKEKTGFDAEKKASSLTHLRGSKALENKLPSEDQEGNETARTIIIPESENGRKSPIQEGKVNIDYISKEQHQATLEEEYRAKLGRKMFH